MTDLVPIDDVAPDAIERLLDAAFGSDRHSRTAYRLRVGSKPISALSFALLDDGQPIACILCWPVAIGSAKLVLVGPVAVHPAHQNAGHGSQLMHHMVAAADTIATPAMVMIGDPEYYGRFGFTADATGRWEMPGPWEPRRLLARNPMDHNVPESGMLERTDAL